MVVEQTDQKTKAIEKVLTTASGATLRYVEADRRATYTTDARLTGSPGDLRADTVVLFFRSTEDAIDRLVATGAVTLKTPDGREGTGQRLEYFAADERYELRGAPVTIVEECRETRGRTLIFFRSVDRIIVDGNEETRTETKGSKCPVKPVK
jgi:lipopolysaccharide export system protein LptA